MAEWWIAPRSRSRRRFGDPSGPVRHTARCAGSASPSWHGTAPDTGLLPSELNFRANIYGMKTLGVEYILSASARRQL
jgi:5'-methylthioadenosine phosphorylase